MLNDAKDEALCKIAVDALRAIQRGTEGRHSDLWQLAVRRVLDTKSAIEGDEEIAAIRRPPPITIPPHLQVWFFLALGAAGLVSAIVWH